MAITINGVSVKLETRDSYIRAYVGDNLLGYFHTSDEAMQAVARAIEIEQRRHALSVAQVSR